jgi:hypothetical protein
LSVSRNRSATACAWLAALACALPWTCATADGETGAGRALLEEALRRHAQPPYVYEELTLVLKDAAGQRRVRTARHYLRSEPDGSLKRLLVFDTPADVHGTALFIRHDADGQVRRGLYLPALGRELRYGADAEASAMVFGTDFSIADLEDERLQDFNYEREPDREFERVAHYAVRARPKDEAVARATGYARRRIYLRKDNYYLSRIDYFDRQGRVVKRQTFRDPQPDGAGAWRPGMILMEDFRERHSTLLKVERRVHSADYVPPELFAATGR